MFMIDYKCRDKIGSKDDKLLYRIRICLGH